MYTLTGNFFTINCGIKMKIDLFGQGVQITVRELHQGKGLKRCCIIFSLAK